MLELCRESSAVVQAILVLGTILILDTKVRLELMHAGRAVTYSNSNDAHTGHQPQARAMQASAVT